MDNDQLIMDNEKIYSEFISGQSKIETLYVLGMAKSSLNLKGAKSEKLELDFLRILHAIKTRKSNEQVIGYLAVWDKTKQTRIESWKKKYLAAQENIEVIPLDEITKKKFEATIKEEKEKNKEGINRNSNRLSEAKQGKEILETFLRQQIESKLERIEETEDDKLFGVNWDYYAKLERKN